MAVAFEFGDGLAPRVAGIVVSYVGNAGPGGSGTPQTEKLFTINNPGRNSIVTLTQPVEVVSSANHPPGATSLCLINAGPISMGRHKGKNGGLLDGGKSVRSADPTYTHWLPLAFSPQIDTQPFRVPLYGLNNTLIATVLPEPWGNINCIYSMSLRRANASDSNGTGNYYWQGGPKANQTSVNTQGIKPAYVITDANGDRLTFGDGFTKSSDILCTVTGTPTTGITLSKAGPPGRIRERGEYTYVFLPLAPSIDPFEPAYYTPAWLNSIGDAHGNRQDFDYSRPQGYGSPFLKVTDITSGRILLFYSNGTGAIDNPITRVVAPMAATPGAAPAVTTTLSTYLGRLIDLKVYNGPSSGTPLYTMHVNYRTDNVFDGGDEIVSVTGNGVTETNTYLKGFVTDEMGHPIFRLDTTTYGLSSDVLSSDDGFTIQAFTRQDYGIGGNNDPSNADRTNTFTNERGYQTALTYHYINPESGSDDGAIAGIDYTYPTFTGAAGATIVKQRFVPNITSPTSSVVTDAMGELWSTSFDATKGCRIIRRTRLAR